MARSDAKTERNAEIVQAYRAGGRTLEALGNIYGLTRERVRQILSAAGMRERRPVPAGHLTLEEFAARAGIPVNRARSWGTRRIIPAMLVAHRLLIPEGAGAPVIARLREHRMCARCRRDFPQRLKEHKLSVCIRCYRFVRYASDPEYRRRHAECVRRWQERHPERVREITRAARMRYNAAHPERIREYHRAYWRRHRVRLLAERKARRAARS